MQDVLTREDILAHLETQRLGRALEVYASIDSTNTRAMVWARQGAPDGALVCAEEQTAGRGRLGRRWHAPAGSSLLFSLILRPSIAPSHAQQITMLCSLGILTAVRSITGVEALIKWPNDLVIGGKKVGGILTELGLVGQRLDFVVVGVGLNVNLDPSAIPEAMMPPTSLSAELGAPVPRRALLCSILQAIEERYFAFENGGQPVAEWRDHLATLGQPVQVGTAEEVVVGVAENVDAEGALLVRVSDGSLRRVLVGDVTLRGHRV